MKLMTTTLALTTLILFSQSLTICLAIRVEEFLARLGPCGSEFRLCDVPIRPAFHKNSTKVLAKFFQSRPSEEPVAQVDLIHDKTRLQDDGVRDHRIV